MPVIASEERVSRWAARDSARAGRHRRWVPRWTVRLRLTMLYGILFLVAGAALLGITYGLVAGDTALGPQGSFQLRVLHSGGVARPRFPTVVFTRRPPAGAAAPIPSDLPRALRGPAVQLQRAANVQIARARSNQLDALLTRSGIALAIMTLVSIALGWVMAGRALRPLRRMNSRVREISEQNLHERLAIEGHDDELRELGDAFDGLLARLEAAFDSQRRFVANASHELQTPVTLERALLEVALADPHADVASLRAVCTRVLRAGEQQERTINALLTLARSERGLEVRNDFDLRDVVGEALAGADLETVRVESELEPAPVNGDPALAERLVANLVENAVRHNDERGWVRITTDEQDGRSVVRVSNTGSRVAADEIASMHEPFRRLGRDRTGHGAGAGLGLSIVDAIARAHGAEVRTTPRSEGGIDVEVTFPRTVERVLAPV
jgi:signal transduction histidine kinase